jgi:hypothetical protein
VVDPGQSAVPLDQFLRRQPSPTRKWPYLGDSVAGDVAGLSSLDSIHDSRWVVPKLTLRDHLHAVIVAGYTDSVVHGMACAELVGSRARLPS